MSICYWCVQKPLEDVIFGMKYLRCECHNEHVNIKVKTSLKEIFYSICLLSLASFKSIYLMKKVFNENFSINNVVHLIMSTMEIMLPISVFIKNKERFQIIKLGQAILVDFDRNEFIYPKKNFSKLKWRSNMFKSLLITIPLILLSLSAVNIIFFHDTDTVGNLVNTMTVYILMAITFHSEFTAISYKTVLTCMSNCTKEVLKSLKQTRKNSLEALICKRKIKYVLKFYLISHYTIRTFQNYIAVTAILGLSLMEVVLALVLVHIENLLFSSYTHSEETFISYIISCITMIGLTLPLMTLLINVDNLQKPVSQLQTFINRIIFPLRFYVKFHFNSNL